jgi:hypothetical protein
MYVAMVFAELMATLRQAVARKFETNPRLSVMAAAVVGLLLFAALWSALSAFLWPARRNHYGSVAGRITATTGEPVTNATVVFMNDAAGVGTSSRTDSGGNYIAHGVQPGSYAVAVQPVIEVVDGELKKEAVEAARSLIEAAVPRKYQELQTSGLQADLKRGRNRFDVNLSTQR